MAKKQEGWACPVCGKGNAPWAAKCGHCEAAGRTLGFRPVVCAYCGAVLPKTEGSWHLCKGPTASIGS
jgi:hypothetical protein